MPGILIVLYCNLFDKNQMIHVSNATKQDITENIKEIKENKNMIS